MKYPVMWMRLENGKNPSPLPISSGDSLLLSSDRRFKLDVDEDESSYTITIKDIRKADAGKYQCQVLITSDGSITEDVELKIKLQPVITKNSLSPTKDAQEGETVELGCEATGFPIPKITWTRQDGSLLPNGKASFTSSRMIIQKVRREDRGIKNYVYFDISLHLNYFILKHIRFCISKFHLLSFRDLRVHS